MNKLKAYTILELVMVMLLSAIVISFAYGSYRVVSGMFTRFKQANEQTNQLALLEKLLRQDFLQADYLTQNERELSCFYPDKRIVYTFEEDHVLRYNRLSDTFFVKPEAIQVEQILAGDQMLVNQLSLSIRAEDTVTFYFSKQYPATVFMNDLQQEEQWQE